MAQPELLDTLDRRQWDDLLVLGKTSQVLARLHGLAEDCGALDRAPRAAAEVLHSARIYADYRQMLARREVAELNVVFQGCGFPVVLLKGAAYLMAGVPLGKGRRLNDIDLLVPREHLGRAESILQDAGWSFDDDLTDYDERYYREWTHELPPMRQPESPLEVDLHHNIIQPTGRIDLDADRLFEALSPVPGTCFSVLSPEDMFLHSATHLFMSDELRGGLRDLVDMQMLCDHFGGEDARYWHRLADRAAELGLERPLYHAAGAMRRILSTPIPQDVAQRIDRWGPGWLADTVLNNAIDRHLAPESPASGPSWFAENLLFVRSHWVRMPLLMLLRHLAYKWWVGLKSDKPVLERPDDPLLP
jgi:hypothetical protein